MNDDPTGARTSKQETLMQRLDRWRAGDGQLIGALIGDATDEIERLTRENEVWRKEVSATLGDNEILYTSQERLRAALAGLKDLTCGECVPCNRINAEIDKALSGEPSAHETSGGWRPIETVPRDVKVLTLRWSMGDKRPLIDTATLERHGQATGLHHGNGVFFCKVTHWMPLPEPPLNGEAD